MKPSTPSERVKAILGFWLVLFYVPKTAICWVLPESCTAKRVVSPRCHKTGGGRTRKIRYVGRKQWSGTFALLIENGWLRRGDMNQDSPRMIRPGGVSRQLPEFRGYKEIGDRAVSDGLIRQTLANALRSAQQKLDRHLAYQVDRGILSSLAVGERLKSRIAQLLQTLKSSENQNASFFAIHDYDDVRLGEIDALENSMISSATLIDTMAAELTNSNQASLDTIGRLGTAIEDLAQDFSLRTSLFQTPSV